MNELKSTFELDSRQARLLRAEFGDANVESALVFITEARDRKGLHVLIPPTFEMVRNALEAVHGRLDVGAVRVSGLTGDDAFYHFPDGADALPSEAKTG